MLFLGIDTSNYATSLALFCDDDNSIVSSVKLMLPVKQGELGLRQSDAVFSHTKNLPEAFEKLCSERDLRGIAAIGVSSRPRSELHSYMPCFLCGVASARSLGFALSAPVFEFSHQQGHVMSALFGCGSSEYEHLDFNAFHVSGGTTDALRCGLNGSELSVEKFGTSLDLFAGQVVDRVGGMLGLAFPSGQALTELALRGISESFAAPVIKGSDCCLSGLENQCRKLIDAGASKEDTARYCLRSIAEVIIKMTFILGKSSGCTNTIYAGGVMSSTYIRSIIKARIPSARFAEPAFLSADNAVGTAILASKAMVNVI